MTKTVEVENYGQRYNLQGEADESYAWELAKYVEDHMQTVAHGMKTATPTKMAILAAMNIAHELFEQRQGRRAEEEEVDRRALGLMEQIEEQLELPRA